jgi:cyclophilin family peptidyl-prolyl cis-trans isomerase
MNYLIAFACALGFLGSISAQVLPPPAAPTNLKVTTLGVNSFLMEWKDNANNEKGVDVRVSLGTVSNPARFLLVPGVNLTSYVVITNDLPGQTLSFQLAAYNGDTGFENFSKYTSVVTVQAMATSKFGAPTNFAAVPINDGSFRLSWEDNSTTENGYQIEYKIGNGEWQFLTNVNPALNFRVPIGGLQPTTTYSFRTRGFKGNPVTFTPYSNVFTETTLAFQAPSNLVAKADGEGAISLKWKDRSAVEEGYEIQSRTGTAEFVSLGNTGPNTTSTVPITGHDLDTSYDFRIRGFRTVNSVKVYTAFSDTATVTTTSLIKPTNLAGEVIDDTTLRVTWDDGSSLETGFQVEARESGTGSYRLLGTVAANEDHVNLARLEPGVLYDIRVRAFNLEAFSGYTPIIQLRTKDGITGDLNPPVFRNTSFSYTVGISRPPQLDSLSVTNLPPGFTFDADTRTISGTTTREGVRTVKLKATFNGSWVVKRDLVLRIIRPASAPVVSSAFAAVQVDALATSAVSLTGKFSDPDTIEARRVTTTKGNFDIILYPLATPETVENFLDYADSGSYDGSFFHRAPADFVVQGGGYLHGGSGFSKIVTFPSVKNEPGISNLAGTVAMAKSPGDPNSATSEFFVNVSDSNAPNLDFQNGGFTVFGRVAGTGMTVVNQISDLPRGDYSVLVGGSAKNLEDVPMNAVTAPASMDTNLLVKVTTVAEVPALRYEVLSADVGVATAVLNGNNVDITGVAAGNTTVTVKAIDLDGQMVSQTIEVTVAPPP